MIIFKLRHSIPHDGCSYPQIKMPIDFFLELTEFILTSLFFLKVKNDFSNYIIRNPLKIEDELLGMSNPLSCERGPPARPNYSLV